MAGTQLPPSRKITVVGDGMVGKTCLLCVYKDKNFPEAYVPTVFDNYSELIEVDGVEYNMKLWDTAGQEDYERLRPLTYPDTKCFLVCFAVNSRSSYNNVSSKWAPEVKYHMPKSPILLIGTKTDLRDDPRQDIVTEKEGKQLKKKIKAEVYMECSAKKMIGIDEIFVEAIRLSNGNGQKPASKEKKGFCVLL